MNKVFFFAIILILSSFSVFAADKDKKSDEEETVPVTYDLLQKGTYSGIKEAMAKVITTQQEWEELWKKHTSVIIPQPPIPEVDFGASVLAVITLGEKNTSGYQIVLKSVEFNSDDIEVTYRTTSPPDHSFTLQALSQPYLVLRIQKPVGSGVVKLIPE
jgi:hypothetical protein